MCKASRHNCGFATCPTSGPKTCGSQPTRLVGADCDPLVYWVWGIVEVKMKGDTKGTLRAPITQAVMDLAREEVKHACNHFEV